MEVRHNEKTDDAGDYSVEFYTIVRRDTVSDVIADPLIFNDDDSADGENRNAEKEPTETKIPIHEFILA